MEKCYRINNIIFTALISMTLFTWLMGQAELVGDITEKLDTKVIFTILLTVAIIKVQLIGDYFMHLNSVKGFWRWIITLWVTLTSGFIAIAFLF